MTVSSKKVRLKADIKYTSEPIDLLTNSRPKVFRASDVTFNISFFDGGTIVSDLSNISTATLEIYAATDVGTALITATDSSFDQTTTEDTFEAGTKQHAQFTFTDSDMSITEGNHYLKLKLTTSGGETITALAGRLDILDDVTGLLVVNAISGPSADGDVTGPSSATDNALARYNGATGKLLQNGQTVEDDSGNLTVAGNITSGGTVDGRTLSTDGSKLDGIEAGADVTDETNVTAALDGATLTSLSPANADKILIQDNSDSDNLKSVTVQNLLNQVSVPVDSVNGATGVVVLDADDIDDTSTVHKFATAAQLSKLDGVEAGAEANVVDSVNTQTGAVVLDADDIDDTSTAHKFVTAAQVTKIDGVESGADVTDETNVKSALDGATISSATVATGDKVLVQDVDDSDNLKYVTAQSIADLGGGGGGLVHLGTTSVSTAAAEIEIEIPSETTYENFLININGLKTDTDQAIVQLYFSTDDGTTYTTNQNHFAYRIQASASLNSLGQFASRAWMWLTGHSGYDANGTIGTGTGEALSSKVMIMNNVSGEDKHVVWESGFGNANGGGTSAQGGGVSKISGVIDKIKLDLLTSAGSPEITAGEIRVYGIVNS